MGGWGGEVENKAKLSSISIEIASWGRAWQYYFVAARLAGKCIFKAQNLPPDTRQDFFDIATETLPISCEGSVVQYSSVAYFLQTIIHDTGALFNL